MKKVSIISPCYNGESYLKRYLDSVLKQTYPNLEFILINDGSTDKTEEIALSYKPLFEEKNIEYKYIFQENGGQAAALNKGLQIFNGDYLTWPDSDDILSEDSVEKKVEFLEKNIEYAVVRSNAFIVSERDMSTVLRTFGDNNPNKYKSDLFFDYILENNVWFAPGCFMVRAKAFLDVLPGKRIYESRAGQNWQILLPIFYKYKCGYINECLYTYVVRESSHSHSVVEINDQIKRCYSHEDILQHTINEIDMSLKEKQYYQEIIEKKYLKKRMLLAAKINDKKLIKKEYKKLVTKKNFTAIERIKYSLLILKCVFSGSNPRAK